MLAFQAVNFLILVWLLHRFLYRPVQRIIAERQEAVRKLTADAQAERDAADKARKALEEERAGIDAEREAAMTQARKAAEDQRKALLEKARAEVDKAREEAKAALEQDRNEAVRDLGRQAARLATAMARRLLSQTSADQVQQSMLDLLCEDVRALPEEDKTQIGERAGDRGKSVDVATAQGLSKAEQGRFVKALSAALGREVALTFKVDPDLIAGVEVRFPFTVMRRSWRDDLNRMEAEMVQDGHAEKVA